MIFLSKKTIRVYEHGTVTSISGKIERKDAVVVGCGMQSTTREGQPDLANIGFKLKEFRLALCTVYVYNTYKERVYLRGMNPAIEVEYIVWNVLK